ncbi:gliding motility-associated C-terminal domain-containing protein [Flavobacteriales bacterium]|nr:gliding motility-associated C-terminal domain-containing protein [Flavobacteriales bacterium]
MCVKPQEIIYIPNSFSPMDKNGLNDLFRPIIGFANYNEYSFKIYNRLGQLIFETNDIQEGWNGKYKGYLIHNEVLIYELLIETSDGQPIKRNGHVSIF